MLLTASLNNFQLITATIVPQREKILTAEVEQLLQYFSHDTNTTLFSAPSGPWETYYKATKKGAEQVA